ncbi:MAG TPA: hypothetical protein VEY50_06860 [Lysobacter sp.]|nr:hypothetical protein [Lysobacter sp.]
MLGFRDFVPADQTQALALSRKFESIEQVLARANAWIADSGVDVVNVETLLLPASVARSGAAAFQPHFQVDLGAFEIGGSHVQVVRVWFRNDTGR